MVDDELLSRGYRFLAESRWSILVFRLPYCCNQGIPLALLTQTLTSVSPGGSSAASQRDTKSTLTSPRSLGLRNPIRWSLLKTRWMSAPSCYTKNYYLVFLTKVYHLALFPLSLLTTVIHLILRTRVYIMD